jgi:integrase
MFWTTVGPDDDRARVDRARPAARRLPHEAHGAGLAARRARPGGARRPAGDGQNRTNVRRRGRRVPPLLGRRPAAQAVDRAGCTLGDPYPPAAALRRAPARGHHRPGRRALGASARSRPAAVERDEAQGHRDLPRRHGPGLPRVPAAGEPGGEGREAAARRAEGDRRLQPGGGPRACPAAASEQDAAIFLTAAFTGLRQGELVALRWRDVAFADAYVRDTASYTNGELSTPKSGKVRSVPMAPEVAEALARLGQRKRFVGADDLVFVGLVGGHLDASALLRRSRGETQQLLGRARSLRVRLGGVRRSRRCVVSVPPLSSSAGGSPGCVVASRR